MRNLLCIALVAAMLVGCRHAPPPTTRLPPEQCVTIGTVSAHGVWGTRAALRRAGIPTYVVGYPTYRILVPPEDRERAVAVLREVERRPTSFGYNISHD